MTARKSKNTSTSPSPLSSMIHQWRHLPEPHESHQSKYRILLQSSGSLATRLQAADSTYSEVSTKKEEDDVYRRAGLRTPAEAALRDWFGGPCWLFRMIEIGVQEECRVIVVRTQTRDAAWMNHRWSSDKDSSNVITLDASQNPWGWDSDGDDVEYDKDSTNEEKPDCISISLDNLSNMYQQIRSICEEDAATPSMLVWESLAPLFLVHGFDRTIKFLKALDTRTETSNKALRILQIWPIRFETLNAKQHATVEDVSNALLSMRRGEMTLMRQGVREAGNVVREVLPFRLVPQEREAGSASLAYQVEEDSSPTREEQEDSKSSKSNDSSSSKTTKVDSGPTFSSTRSGRAKVQLRMEEEGEGGTAPKTVAPRIYMQDDDPEFDDLDEEDPDDDLDI